MRDLRYLNHTFVSRRGASLDAGMDVSLDVNNCKCPGPATLCACDPPNLFYALLLK